MALGKNGARGETWSSVVFGTDRVTIAEIARPAEGKPRVTCCEGFARAGSELETLKRLKSAGHLDGRRRTTLLNAGEYQLLQIDLPGNAAGLPREELREALRWRIKEMVDFPVEQAGIDILEIPATGNRPPQVWVVVASHAMLQPRIQLFQAARVALTAIDIPELAHRNLARLFEEPNRGLAFLSWDRQGGRLTITYQGELYMTRYIDASITELSGPDAADLRERVLLDIQRSLDNFDRNHSAISLTQLRVGPLPGGSTFLDYLGANLSLPVAGANLAEVMDFTQTPELANPAAQVDAWLALGAALRD